MPGTLQGYLTDQVSSKAFSIRTCYYRTYSCNQEYQCHISYSKGAIKQNLCKAGALCNLPYALYLTPLSLEFNYSATGKCCGS